MDLISTIAGNLGIPQDQAQALAGGFLATVQGKVAAEAGGDAAAQMAQAVPELEAWKAKAAQMASAPTQGGGGLFGQLAGLAGGGLGNQILGAVAGKEAADQAMFVSLLTKFGLDASQAAMAAGPAMAFLKDRVPPEWMDMARQAMPMLDKLDAEGDGLDADDLKGLLGGLLG